MGQHSAPLKAPQLALGVKKASASAGNPRAAATDDARQRGAPELRLLLPAGKASVWRVGARTTGRRPLQDFRAAEPRRLPSRESGSGLRRRRQCDLSSDAGVCSRPAWMLAQLRKAAVTRQAGYLRV